MIAVIFDCDGVLVDSEVIYAEAFALALTEFGRPLSADFLRRQLQGRSLAACYQWLLENCQFAATPEFEFRLEWHTQRLIPIKLRAIEGVHTVLEQITCSKAVASNGQPESVESNLRRCNLWHFFEPHVYTSNQVSSPKPAPDIYQYAAMKLNVECTCCCVVEDSVPGVTAALNAGMRVCWLNHGDVLQSVPYGVTVASSMKDVTAWLQWHGCLQ